MINETTIDEENAPNAPQLNALMAPLADPFPQRENALFSDSGSESMRPFNALYDASTRTKSSAVSEQSENALYSRSSATKTGLHLAQPVNALFAPPHLADHVGFPSLADIGLRETVPTSEPNALLQGNALLPQGPRSATPRVVAVQDILDLGRLVRERRIAMRLSQQEFADLSGVGRRFVSELEQGKPTLEIAKVLIAVAAAGIDLYAISR